MNSEELRLFRKEVQIIFQDPYSSLNPRMTIGNAIMEPMQVHNILKDDDERKKRVEELLSKVSLDPTHFYRYPHEFSGGQRQRIGIARALALGPDFIVADEPISALDVSIQAQIMNLLSELRENLGLTLLFIAHDLAAIRHVSDRIAVMYLGRIVELADAQTIVDRPQHPYTQALLSAVPVPDPKQEQSRRRTVLSGEIPSPINPPSGCPFHTRCPFTEDRCRTEVPRMRTIDTGHQVACHLVE